jgi:hypothetical protein
MPSPFQNDSTAFVSVIGRIERDKSKATTQR